MWMNKKLGAAGMAEVEPRVGECLPTEQELVAVEQRFEERGWVTPELEDEDGLRTGSVAGVLSARKDHAELRRKWSIARPRDDGVAVRVEASRAVTLVVADWATAIDGTISVRRDAAE